MTAMVTGRPRAEALRQSVLAMLGDSRRPRSTAELEADHGQFLTGRIYSVLSHLQAGGEVVRQRCLRVSPGRTVFWWLPGRPLGDCVIAGCDQPATEFVPPRFDVKESHITDPESGRRSLLWREQIEVPGSGGCVCANTEHQRILLIRSAAAWDDEGTTKK